MSKDTLAPMDTSQISESTKSPMKELKPSPVPVVSIEPEYQGFFHMLEKQTELLIKALGIESLVPNFMSTSGYEIKPFGAYRLKILEIFALLIKIGTPFEFMGQFCKYRIFETVLVYIYIEKNIDFIGFLFEFLLRIWLWGLNLTRFCMDFARGSSWKRLRRRTRK